MENTIKTKAYNPVTGITESVPDGSSIIDAYVQDEGIHFIWLWTSSERVNHRKHMLLPAEGEPIRYPGFPRREYLKIVVEMPCGERRYLFEAIGEDLSEV